MVIFQSFGVALFELEPENYPANVRAASESVDEYKECLKIVENGLYNKELETAYSNYNTAKGNFISAKENMSDGSGTSSLEEFQEAYAAVLRVFYRNAVAFLGIAALVFNVVQIGNSLVVCHFGVIHSNFSAVPCGFQPL